MGRDASPGTHPWSEKGQRGLGGEAFLSASIAGPVCFQQATGEDVSGAWLSSRNRPTC